MLDLDDLDDDTVIDDVIPQYNPAEEAFDTLLNAEVSIDVGDKHTLGTVTKRARGANGRPIGQRDDNLLLDTVCMRFKCQTNPFVNSYITSYLRNFSRNANQKGDNISSSSG